MNHQKHGAMPGTTAPENTTLYPHPDGFSIAYSAGHLIVVDDMGVEIHVPIGQSGLLELGSKLAGIGMALDALAAYHRMGGTA